MNDRSSVADTQCEGDAENAPLCCDRRADKLTAKDALDVSRSAPLFGFVGTCIAIAEQAA